MATGATKFERLTAQAVKSISQRSLLWQWNDLAGQRRFPPLSDFQPDARKYDPRALIIWGVEQTEGFRCHYQGARIKQAFGDDWVGRTMADVVPSATRQHAPDTVRRCVETGDAIFSVISSDDLQGKRIDCERLILPFGDGSRVDRIVVSMELISLEGSFEEKSVLYNYRSSTEVNLTGQISSGLIKPKPARAPGVVIQAQTAHLLLNS